MEIRQMRQEDAGAVRELDQRIRGPERSVTWDQYVRRALDVVELETLMFPPWGCFVAEEDGRIVGFLISERQTPTYGLPPGARIVAMAVDRDFRRQGIGRRLVDALSAACRKEGVDEIYSVLRSEDADEARFLKTCGFDTSALTVFSKRA